MLIRTPLLHTSESQGISHHYRATPCIPYSNAQRKMIGKPHQKVIVSFYRKRGNPLPDISSL